MLRTRILLCAVAAASLIAGCAEPTAQQRLAALVSGPANELAAFTPTVTFKIERWNRHVPMLYSTTPWGKEGRIKFEVPEYVHGRAPGDKRRGFLFSGRPLKIAAKLGGVRYRSAELPAWREIPGGLALDNKLADGLTIHFRIVASDRMIEIAWGLTNDGDKPIRHSWAQMCVKGVLEPVLAERMPTSSWMLGDGKLITWDAAGQDLSFIANEREADGVRFKRSCFFWARVGQGPAKGRIRLTEGKSAVFDLARKVDIPAIAKADQARRQALVIYSPSAKNTFYNYYEPCFHADPYLGEVPAKSTRWTRTYLMFVEGDLEAFMQKLSAAHQEIAAETQGK